MFMFSRSAVRAHGPRLPGTRFRPEYYFVQHHPFAIRFTSSDRKRFKFPASSTITSAFLAVATVGIGMIIGVRLRAASVPLDAAAQSEGSVNNGELSNNVILSRGGDNEDQSSNPRSINEAQNSPKDNDQPAIFMQFGPDASFFISSEDRWQYHGSATTARAMDELEMDTPYIVALASNGGLFAAYKSIVGSVPAWNLFVDDTQKQKVQVWQHKDDEWIHECTSHDAYQMLAKWLPQNFENDTAGFQKCNLTFGPGDSFYVRSPKGCLWNNLPASLEDIILKQMGKGGLGPPETVSLGAGKTWVTTWDGKHYLWMLGSHYYNDVHEELKVNNKDHTGGINYIAISPYEDAYFIHFNNGIFKYHCRVDKRAEKDFNHFIYKFLQERALVDKVSYNLTDKNDRKSIVISPTTSFEEFESFMELSKEPSLQSWMRWLWKKIL